MTSPLEKEVLNALFRQEKPIIFSLKSGLEKLGRGHHKTSHMNRNQHADALMKGLDATKGSKQDWTEGNLWGRVLDFANKKKLLNDIRLNAIWELVKKNGKWSDEYAKVSTKVEEKYFPRGQGAGPRPKKQRGEIKSVGNSWRGDVREIEVPDIPEGQGGSVLGASAPAPPERPEVDKTLLKVKDDRIALLEKRNRELLNEVQEEKRFGKQEVQRSFDKNREIRDLLRRLAFYEGGEQGRLARLIREYDPDDKVFEFNNLYDADLSVEGRKFGNISEFSEFILLPVEKELILFDKENALFYDKSGRVIGKGDFSQPDNSVIKNVVLEDKQFTERIEGQADRRLGTNARQRTQIAEFNRKIERYFDSDREDDDLLGEYLFDDGFDRDIILEEKPEGSRNFVAYDDDADIIGEWDPIKGLIRQERYREEKRKREEEEKRKEREKVEIEGTSLSYKGFDYKYNPETKEIMDEDDDEVVGKVYEEGGELKIKFEGYMATSEEDTDEESTDEDTDDDTDSDIETDTEQVQLEFVDLIVTEIDYDEAKGRFDSELVNEEADVLGFFNNRDDLSGKIDWEDLDDFEWLSESVRQTYLETMRDLMEDSGAGYMITSAEARVPKKIFKKVQDQQIGGMTKGHFHKEVPVILHGGELVIPKKHVEEVMRQSPLAHQISKIPPTWQKIKKIVK